MQRYVTVPTSVQIQHLDSHISELYTSLESDLASTTSISSEASMA